MWQSILSKKYIGNRNTNLFDFSKCFQSSWKERKTSMWSEVDKDPFEANQDVDDTNKGVYCPLYDIIDGPNGICMKETKIPFDFYKMFLTLWN